MKYVTLEGESLKNFKTFGIKIYSITCVRRSCGNLFYTNDYTIVYKEKWYLKIIKKLKKE